MKWVLFLILINIFFAAFFWSLSKIPIISLFLRGFICGCIMMTFSSPPLIFMKNAKPYARLLMVFVFGAIGNAVGLEFISAHFYHLPYDLFMFNYIINMLVAFIIIGFLYYWEGIAAANSMLQEERIKRLDIEKEMVQTRLKLVQTPIEPGFLFNTLKEVIRLLDLDVEKAKSLQMRLIQYLRLSLPKLKKETHSITQEMELIRAYLDIVKRHQGALLDYKIDISSNLHHHDIPSMLIYLIVERVADYVGKSSGAPKKLFLRGVKNQDGVQIEIDASPLGPATDQNILSTFQNIKDRVYKTFGDKAHLLLKTEIPGNFEIVLKIAPTQEMNNTRPPG